MNEIEVQKVRNTEIIQQTLKNQIQLQVNSANSISKEKYQRKKKTNFKKWRNLQKIRYLMYLSIYKSDLEGYNPQSKMQTYLRMSDFIGATFQDGCGYYHRQFLNKFQTIEGVIEHLKMTLVYNIQELKQQCERIKQILKNYQIKKLKQLEKFTEDCFDDKSIQLIKCETIDKQINCPLNLSLNSEIFQQTKDQGNLTQITLPIEILLVIKRKSDSQHDQIDKSQLKKIEQAIDRFKQNFRTICPHKRKYLTKKKKLQKLKQRNQQMPKSNRENSKDYKQKQIVSQINLMQQSKKIRILWTKTQTVKLLIFLNIHKENIQYYFHNNRIPISKKCSQYINTNKTPRSCIRRMVYLCNKIKQPIMKMIQIQTKRLQIPSDLIQKEKEQYFYKEKNVFRSKITFASSVINHKISKKQIKQISLGFQNQSKILLQSNLKLILNFVHQNEWRRTKNSRMPVLQKNEIRYQHQQLKVPRIKIEKTKKIIEIQVQSFVFQIIKSTFKHKSILELKDFLLLKKNNNQIVNLIHL